jgi:hypothetical protein
LIVHSPNQLTYIGDLGCLRIPFQRMSRPLSRILVKKWGVNDKRKMWLEPIVTMPKCHICGRSGPYTEMIDYMVYSIHPKCEHKLLITLYNIKEFKSCSICKKTDASSKGELKSHLIDNHTKEALADLIVDSIY